MQGTELEVAAVIAQYEIDVKRHQLKRLAQAGQPRGSGGRDNPDRQGSFAGIVGFLRQLRGTRHSLWPLAQTVQGGGAGTHVVS
jgi:hypothetical protein